MKLKHTALAVAALAASFSAWADTDRQAGVTGMVHNMTASSAPAKEGIDEHTNFMPQGGYASTIANTRYVEPSAQRKLAVGEKISRITERNKVGEVILQRLTDRSYWVQTGFYNTLFYVGDKGVLLMDPLGDGSGKKVQEAIAKVTKLPVTAVLYSHDHADHIGDIGVFVDAAKQQGVKLRIIASDATAAKQQYLHSQLPKPTETVAFKNGKFQFENLTVQAQGFERASHTDDSAGWLMVQEGIMHAPDVTNPDQMPYLGFGGSENAVYLEGNLQQLANGNWRYFNGGHGNIGSKADIAFMQGYMKDLRAALNQAFEKISADDYFNERMNNHEAAAHAYNEAVAKYATDVLRPKYGKFYGFEASVPHQADMMIEAVGSYR